MQDATLTRTRVSALRRAAAKVEEAALLLPPHGLLLLHVQHALAKGGGDVLPVVRAHHLAHIGHLRAHHRLEEGQQVQQRGVLALQLPRLELCVRRWGLGEGRYQVEQGPARKV